ncbi:MAG: CRISPR-associated helicase Cas3' [Thermoguttaceae bacterium]|jgi:CRISPR-associated endonuclease/helicase Cas3|nr:CRISPR-associated helicase Cas3' [Thermoguttaceae bacterium]
MNLHFAHSKNHAGVEHLLVQHLDAVAELARRFAARFDAGELAYWAGKWHDLGKFHPEFTKYLLSPDARRGPDHSSAGMVYAWESLELLALVIGGHHAGLDSRENLKCRWREKRGLAAIREALEIARREMAALAPSKPLLSCLPAFLHTPPSTQKGDPERSAELLIRMLFSALVDADFLDTEAHFCPEQAAARGPKATLGDLRMRFEENQARLMAASTGRLNQLRREIYEHCRAAGTRPQGCFRLTAPTGGAKTRSSLGFALAHALHHGLERVIVAIPYTSIIEQTADVYRGIFGDEEGLVLEHHSAVVLEETHEDPVTEHQAWSRLASQNWDAPIVVTTTVQLFESLFANRPGRCRKLHNLARSVIVLDEVQTLPPGLLEPILDVLRQLVAHYRVTVVLCTATQPALDDSPYLRGLPNVQELLPQQERYFDALRRVHYEIPAVTERWTWGQTAERLRAEPQALAIVNTKKDAMALLDALDDPAALHLSTLMCGAHRRAVLHEVRQRLHEGKPCRLVSTQVVEAGVDLDFPVVLRAVGPLDRIVQAAGRCNREGKLDRGRVIVFHPAEGGLPRGAYRSGYDLAGQMLRSGCDLDDPRTYQRYFHHLYQAVELDSQAIQPAREHFDYPTVAQKFRMIADDSVSVVVRPPGHEKQVDELLAQVGRQAEAPDRLTRRFQPYVVGIYAHLLPQYERDGLLCQVTPGLWQWLGSYDRVRGLVSRGQDPEQLVV